MGVMRSLANMNTIEDVAIDQQTPHAPARAAAGAREPGAPASRPQGLARLLSGGTAGNERLTEVSGVLLIILLAVLGVTILRLNQLISVHLFVGMLLIPPVLLKMGSTGYRFALYYTGDPRYRRKGPPQPLLRLLAPLVVLSTVIVFATGVVLLLAGTSSREPVLLFHKASFIVWLGATGLHVLAHLTALPRALRGEYTRSGAALGESVPGRSGRSLALAGALVAGVILAVVLIPEFAAWEHWASTYAGN